MMGGRAVNSGTREGVMGGRGVIRGLRVLLLGMLLGACARPAPPSADARQRAFPDLGGRAVMLLPVQAAVPTIGVPPGAEAFPLGADARAALEAELAYWLPARVTRARWVLPAAIERAVGQSPTLDVRVRDLTVRDFQRARLEMIGDPLYGELRRVAALMDTRVALLPVGALWVRDPTGMGRVHLALALIDTFGGDVVWYGVVAGAAGAPGDAALMASVAQALVELIP
jgi:hypothetical protein